MTFLTGYFDESGKRQTHKIVSFCGFVDSNWSNFLDEWGYLLRRNRISCLHLSKSSLKATATVIEKYRPFVQAIKKHVEMGFGVAVAFGKSIWPISAV
jgi:hypothetical protein